MPPPTIPAAVPMGANLPKPVMGAPAPAPTPAPAAAQPAIPPTVAAPQPSSGMSLKQAILYAKTNPTSDFASTLGGFITRGEADDQALKEGIDLSFAGRPSLKDMYKKAQDIKPPAEPNIAEKAGKAYMDTIGEAADTTQKQQMAGAEHAASSIEKGGEEIRKGSTEAGLEGAKDQLEGVFDAGAGAASGAVQSIFAPATGLISALSDKASDTKAVQELANGAGPLVDLYDQLNAKIDAIAKAHPDAAARMGDAANVLLSTLGGETEAGAMDVGDATKEAATAARDAAGNAIDTAKQAVSDATGALGKTGEDVAGGIKKTAAGAKAVAANASPMPILGRGAKAIYSNVYGLPADTTDFLVKNPQFATPEALNNANIHNIGMDVKAAHEKAIADLPTPADLEAEVQAGLQKKVQAINEHAKQYSTLGNDSAPGAPRKAVNVDPNWLKNQLEQVAGVKIGEDGRISHGDASARINPADSPNGAAIMQNLWDTYGPEFAKGKMSQAMYLKFRQSLATVANYRGGVDTVANKVAHTIRDNLNKEYRPQIPGLDKLDAEHTKMERDLEDSLPGLGVQDPSRMNNVKMNEGAASNILNAGKDTKGHLADRLENIAPGITKKIERVNKFNDEWNSIFDERGDLKPNALNNIKNAVNAGRDLRLQSLERLLPGITDKLKLAKAAEDFHAALGPKAGLYGRQGIAATGALIGNSIVPVVGAVPGWLAGMYATSPEMGLRVLRAFARHGSEALPK